MDFQTAPEIIDAIIKRVQHGVFGYSVIPDEWYSAYINWWKDRHHIEYSKNQLIFSTGVIPIISRCVRKLTTPGENVLIMTPVYNIFFNCIKNNGRNVQDCALDYSDGNYSIDFDKLEKMLADQQIKVVKSNATYLLWLDCSALGVTANKLTAHIRKETGLMLSSGEIYGKESGKHFLRMNIACPKSSVLDGLNG